MCAAIRSHTRSAAEGAALLYLVAMASWVYLVVDTPRRSESPWDSGAVFLAALLLHLGVGLAIGRSWALLLPLAAALIAVPAGYAYGDSPGDYDFFPVLPIWVGILFAQAILAPVLGAGIVTRIVLRKRRADAV
jgi:hypothetical protein